MIVEKDETGSTNDDAKAMALAGAPHGAAVLARAQSAGRGRAGRRFLSPEGGLYLSVVLRPRAPPHHWGLLPVAIGARVVNALRLAGFPATLKWPNDVLLDGLKAGGILVESRMGSAPFAIVGLGLNLASAPRGTEGATFLSRHAPAPEPRALAETMRAAIVGACDALDAGGAAAALPDIRAVCATLGRRVEWEKGEGVAVDVAEDGTLVVERTDGARERIVAGDVRLRVAHEP